MATRQQAAREFVKTWSDPKKGREDADRQTFWNDLLQRVYGINNYYDYITYEKNVPVKADGKVTTRRIDGYIPSTKVLIEMKDKRIKDLSKPIRQSGDDMLTPYQQAKRYANFLPTSEYPKWIIVSNFTQIDIHNMDKPLDPPTTIKLKDLPTKFKTLEFLVDVNQQQIINEKQLSVDAGSLVAKIYDSLYDAYSRGRNVDMEDPKILQSLNMLIVRLVFLLYADDTGILGDEDIFQSLMENANVSDIRQILRVLFDTLDTPMEQRDPYLDQKYNQFAYVNGGMFSNEDVIIPQFTPELKDLIVNEAGRGFNWSNISPTIFGAVFESTLNPDERRSGGMHYTSIENIHKVIDPLFLNDLHDEFDKIQNMGNRKQRIQRAKEFQDKIGKLKFLDPACGSGNFLTETYLSLRKMENQCLQIIYGNQPVLATGNIVKVKIQNFYGIEINDFAVSVARTAMWIAENQMLEQTKNTVYYNKDFLPLDSNDSIYEGNALRLDWSKIVKPYELNYIMGNPPFVGARQKNKSQRNDMIFVFGKIKGLGNIDYVSAWYKKAANYIHNTTIKVSYVSTSSIVEGEQNSIIFNPLLKHHIHINYAYTSFAWDNEAKEKAHVHVIIVGFGEISTDKKIIYSHKRAYEVKNINNYLTDAPNVYLYDRKTPLNKQIPIHYGSFALDNGNFTISQSEYKHIKSIEPNIDVFLRPFIGAKELLHNKKRYCVWLKDISPNLINKSNIIKEKVEAVKNWRNQSTRKNTKKLAAFPTVFAEIRQPQNDYLAIPTVSSCRRDYVPMSFLNSKVIASNQIYVVPNAGLYEFSILNSSTHMAWVNTVAGRLETRYRYSAKIVYNNFPWPDVNDEQKKVYQKQQKAS